MNLFVHWWILVLPHFLKQNAAQDKSIQEHSAWEQLPTTNCGQSGSRSRIVGGEEASLGQFPWMARLGFRKGRYSSVFNCGATIISRKYVISAAHCFPGKGHYFVRLGEHNFGSEVDCEGTICAPPPQDIPVDTFHLHENYTSKEHYNDIALLELKYNATLNEFVRPICLPQGGLQDPTFGHTGEGIVAGWGVVSAHFNYASDVLMFVSMKLVDKRECTKIFHIPEENYSQLCVGTGNGKDSCGGDSGGPLMKKYRMSGDIRRYYLLGVVSYGLEKCGLGPGVYTNVAYFLKWILDHIK